MPSLRECMELEKLGIPVVDTWEELIALRPPCAECGTPYEIDMPEGEKAETLAAYHRMLENRENWKMQQSIVRMPWHCAKCQFALQDEDTKRRKAKRVFEARQASYGKDMLPSEAKSHVFSSSRADVESRNQHWWDRLRAWSAKVNLWIYGAPGTGKTFLAHCLMNQRIEQHAQECGELSAFKLCDFSRRYNVNDLLKPYIDVPILLIEDLDKSSWTNEGVSALWYVCDRRRAGKGATIITAQLDPPAWSNRVSAIAAGNKEIIINLLERLIPMERVMFQGESMRREEQQQKGGML